MRDSRKKSANESAHRDSPTLFKKIKRWAGIGLLAGSIGIGGIYGLAYKKEISKTYHEDVVPRIDNIVYPIEKRGVEMPQNG